MELQVQVQAADTGWPGTVVGYGLGPHFLLLVLLQQETRLIDVEQPFLRVFTYASVFTACQGHFLSLMGQLLVDIPFLCLVAINCRAQIQFFDKSNEKKSSVTVET